MTALLVLSGLALADRVYWVDPPSPEERAAVAEALPAARALPLDALVSGEQAVADPGPAIDALRRELAAVRPLADAFDGELQIMARLEKAASDVVLLREEADAELLWHALLFQGFAVHRYFQDTLGTDPAAAPYRVGQGEAARVSAWLDAAALMGPAMPDPADIPEPAQRLGYDDVRAYAQVMPAAVFEVGATAAGAEIRLDGRPVRARPGERVLVVPGRHLFHVEAGGVVLLRGDVRVKEGGTVRVEAPFGPAERDALAALARSGAAGWTVPDAAMMPVRGADEPVYLAVPGGRAPRLLRVDGGVAQAVRLERPRPERGAGALAARVALGAGWLSTGDFFLQNAGDGAPYTAATVNSVTPAVSLSGELRRGLLVAGAGVDAQYTLGEWHVLPTGGGDTRAFVYPHVAVGVPWVQATAGLVFPWYAGVGLKARLPIDGQLEAVGSAVYGPGLTLARAVGPDFQPQPLYAGWVGVAYRVD